MLSENLRYKELKVMPGTYVPEVRDDYPTDDPYVRLYKPVYTKNQVFDENYPYYENNWKSNLLHKLGYAVILYAGIGTLLRLNAGLKIEGRENLKKYKKELSKGWISLGNHVHRHDCEAILIALGMGPTTKIPMFSKNFNTKDGFFMWLVGGIPIPPEESGLSAMKKFNAAFDEYDKEGCSFHIFPEACKWDWYTPLRPFQKGAFTMSYKYNKPLIPCGISWRKRTGIYRLFGPKDKPLMTVRIGEPIFPNTDAPRKVEVERLREACHLSMQKLMGIEKNSWPVAMD